MWRLSVKALSVLGLEGRGVVTSLCHKGFWVPYPLGAPVAAAKQNAWPGHLISFATGRNRLSTHKCKVRYPVILFHVFCVPASSGGIKIKAINRDSSVDTVTGWMAVVILPTRAKYFSPLHSIQSPIQLAQGLRVKPLEREADQSAISSAEVKNDGAIESISHMSS